jgi:very-short-patch-repair endonuclease/predicted SPOUT superfamily RNA methylase MTH1
MGKKLTFEYVKNYFIEQECELLETEYKNANTKMKYKCKNGHITDIIFKSFKKGSRCAKCNGNKKYTFNEVYNYFIEQKCELLSQEYINIDTKMKYKCYCGNESQISFNSFKRGHRCSKCYGNEKLTFKYVKNYFIEQECELLETEYKSNNTKMKYRCDCGNESNITFNNFQNGHRCIKCSGKEKLTYEYVKNYFTEQDCELLETEYKNANTKIKYKCKNGHITDIIFSSFKNGNRCAECNGNKKYTFNEVYNYFIEQKCELLSQEYINIDTKMKYKCYCGNESQISFNSFKNGCRCIKCSGNEKLTFKYVKNYFTEQDCELLDTEYINNETLMEYKCKCSNISKISYASFKKGHRCIKCGGKEKLTLEYVKNYFKEQNCELLSNEYINANTKIEYICECKNNSEITYANFKNGSRCNMCKNKTELKLLKWVKEIYSQFIIKTQVKFDWCKNKRLLPFDFYIEDLNLIIELDGPQHFKQVSNWKSPEETKIIDDLKNKLALENNFKVIRICQRIVWDDKEDWDIQLKEAISNINQIELIKIGSVYN